MTFEFDAEKYKAASAHQKEWGKKLISGLNLTGSERVLDLGCGDGGITAQLAEIIPDGMVVGIDASQSMIESAQKNYKVENMRFDLMDINAIDFDNEFDIVFSNATLHWVRDHNKLLANVYKSLKADGISRFNFAADGNCSNFFEVIRQTMAEKRYAEYFGDFDWPWYMPAIDEYEKIVTHSGFAEVKVWGENADRYFADAETMTKWVDQPSLVPFLKCVGQKDKRLFRDTVVERMIEQTIQDDGRCFETFRRINVFAKK
jgi:trans-aconitate methyltransferase